MRPARSRGVFRTDRQFRRQPQQVLVEQFLLAPGRPALEAENGKGPQHEDKTGLLLVVLDNDEERTLLDIPGIGLHLYGLVLEKDPGLRPNETDIQCMHQDKSDQQ